MRAASVHPEPGSNSFFSFPSQIPKLSSRSRFLSVFTLRFDWSFYHSLLLRQSFLWLLLPRCYTVRFSTFSSSYFVRTVALSRSALLSYHTAFTLSRTFFTFFKAFIRSCFSQTAHIFYHKLFCLSRTFLKTFFFSLSWSLSSNFYMLPHLSWSVNNFFGVFSTFLHSLYRLFPFFNGGYTITP